MANLYDWSTTPADNDDADSGMTWAENQAPSTVNDSARQLMARVAEWRKDLAGSITTGGTGNAYTVTVNSTLGASYPDGLTVVFTADRANGGSSTLSVNGGAAVPMRHKKATALPANALVANQQYVARYILATNEFIVSGTRADIIELAPSLLSAQVFGLRVGDPIISFAPSPNPGFLRLTEATQAVNKAAYPDLNSWASGLGYPWGSASTTFNLPPAAGYFLRFAGTSATVDPDGPRAAGSTQNEGIKHHVHGGFTENAGDHAHNVTINGFRYGGGGSPGVSGIWSSSGDVVASSTPSTVATSNAGTHFHNVNTTTTAGATPETRPKNVAFHLDILATPALVASGLIGTVGNSYRYSTATAAADPGAGYLRFDNTTIASASLLYISDTDALGADLSASIATWDSSTSTVKGRLRFVKVGAPATFAEFDIVASRTDNGSWSSFSITHRASAGTLSDVDNLHVLFVPKGDAGAGGGGGGGGGGDVVGPASSTDSHVVLFNGTTGKLIKSGGALGTAAFQPTGAFDASGTSAAATAAHLAASDPHTQYHTDGRGDARYVRFDAAQTLTQSQRQVARNNLDLDDAPLVFDTLTLAKAESIDTSINTFETRGYRTAGDNGHGVYKRLGSAPSPTYAWHAQSADGAWWVLSEAVPRPQQFGAYVDGTTHPLSGTFGTLGAAQALFPWANALTNEFDWCAAIATWRYLPFRGGVTDYGVGTYMFQEPFYVGNGTATTDSDWQNITIKGAGRGAQKDLFTSVTTPVENACVFKCTAPSVVAAAVWILGPISANIEGVVIDVNNKATRGLYNVHNNDYVMDVSVINYRDYAHDLAAIDTATTSAGVYSGHAPGVYRNPLTAAPQLSTSASFVIGNATTVMNTSQIKIENPKLTCGDSGSQFILRYCDNIEITGNGFSYSATGKHKAFDIQPPSGAGGIAFPQMITVSNFPVYSKEVWPAIGTWNPGRRGIIFNPYRGENADQNGPPFDVYGRVKGFTQDGTGFGWQSSAFYGIGAITSPVSNTTTETTIAAFTDQLERFALTANRRATATVDASFRQNSGAASSIRVRLKADISAAAVTVAANKSLAAGDGFARQNVTTSAVVITLPALTGVRVGTPFWVENTSAGNITLVAGSGATTSGAGSLTVAAGSARRLIYDGVSNWDVTAQTIRATLADTGVIAVSDAAGFRSLRIRGEILSRTNTSQHAKLQVQFPATANNGNSTAVSLSTYEVQNDAAALDYVAPYTLTVTYQPGNASATFDTYVLLGTLELS